MATDNDDRDDESADSEYGLVCISRCELGSLLSVTGETIDYEDHETFVVMFSEDLARLRKLAFELEQEFSGYDEDAA